MMRSWYPWSRQNRSSGTASSSPVTGSSTAFTFTGLSPAAFAAGKPGEHVVEPVAAGDVGEACGVDGVQ